MVQFIRKHARSDYYCIEKNFNKKPTKKGNHLLHDVLFAMKNMMTNIPVNFSSSKIKHKYVCGDNKEMKHVYTSNILNSEKPRW